jgi:hypothetical protein
LAVLRLGCVGLGARHAHHRLCGRDPSILVLSCDQAAVNNDVLGENIK